MAQKLKGVGGVLGGLISSPEESPSQPEARPQPEQADQGIVSPPPESPVAPAQPPRGESRIKARARIAVRRGRPPGQPSGNTEEKEKVTLRLSKAVMNDYREWTWEERCQLGELIERAMIAYRKNRRPKSQ